MRGSSVSQACQQIIARYTQEHVDYVVETRDAMLGGWGSQSLRASKGPRAKVVPSFHSQEGFLQTNTSRYAKVNDAVVADYGQNTGNLELKPLNIDWKPRLQRAASGPRHGFETRAHLGQLIFHEQIHSLDPRSKPPQGTGWLAYYQSPLEITAHAGSIAWEMHVRRATSMRGSPVCHRIVSRLKGDPGTHAVYASLLAETAAWVSHLASLSVSP